MGLFSGIASIFGGGAQKRASRAAENAQLGYLSQALDFTKDQNAQTQGQLSPFIQSGTGALDQINALLGISTAGTPGAINYGAYVSANPDLMNDWRTKHSDMTADQYGEWHYNQYGQFEPQRGSIDQYRTGGTSGFDGAGAQAGAIAALEASPQFQALVRNGEESVLQNASATGGLRGGNVQRGLANFRSDALVQTINDQLTRLGGLSGAGLSAANSAGQFGAGAAAGVSNILGQQGQVRAGGLLTRGGITAGQMGNIGGILDQAAGAVIPGGGSAANIGGILKGLF